MFISLVRCMLCKNTTIRFSETISPNSLRQFQSMSTLQRFMAFETQARSYIIKLLDFLNKIIDQPRLAIPFTDHNFGPLDRIFFVIVPFDSKSKTLCRVLLSSLYLQIFMFYFGISISEPNRQRIMICMFISLVRCMLCKNTTIRFSETISPNSLRQFQSMSTLQRFMAFETQARSYIIKLLDFLNKIIDQPRLAIPFTDHNFGPLDRIFFVIVPFDSKSKTLCRVLLSSLYLQIFMFYFGISISEPNPNRKYNPKTSKQ